MGVAQYIRTCLFISETKWFFKKSQNKLFACIVVI
jgi:hypothetical protein